MSNKYVIVILFLSSLSLIVTPPPVVLFVCGLLQMFYIPGIVFMLFLGDRERRGFDNLFFPPLISPILLSVLVLAIHKATGDLRTAIKISLIILYLLLLAGLLVGRFRPLENHAGIPFGILLVSFVFSGLILTSYFLNGFLVIRSDAWYHASIVNEIMNRGVPPLEPAFPDIPIRYMWIYHLFLAIWGKLSGLSLFQAMGFFNIVNAFVFPYLIARFISFFTGKILYIVAVPIFAIAGLESASWILWPINLVRALFGEVKGVEEIRRVLSNIELNGAHVIDFLSPHWTWMVNLIDKFLTVTAFSYSLNLFLLCFIFVISKDFHRRSPIKSLLNIFIVTLGALLFHLITGISLILTIAGSGILIALIERTRKRNIPIFQSVFVTGAAILAAVISLPYIASLMEGGAEGDLVSGHLHLGLTNIFTIVAPLLVLFYPARLALRHIFALKTDKLKTLGTWIVCLLIINIFIDLPTVNESKFVFPLFLLLGPLIAWQIIDWIKMSIGLKRVLLSIWIVVLFLVPPVLTFRGFILEKPRNGLEAKRYTITEEDREFFDWIKNNTDSDAIIIENKNYGLIPIYTQRRNFYSPEQVVNLLSYKTERVRLYREIHEQLFTEAPLEKETIESLRSIGQDIYILVRKEDLKSVPYVENKFLDYPDRFVKVYEKAQIRLYLLR